MRIWCLVLFLVCIGMGAGIDNAKAAPLLSWGPRVGFSSDPDQVFVGAHMHLLDIVPNLRLQPNVELGFGDKITRLALNGDVLWMFSPITPRWSPYLGGELSINYLKFDLPSNAFGIDDSTTDLGLTLVGGSTLSLAGGTKLLLELKIGLVDAPDLEALVGWVF